MIILLYLLGAAASGTVVVYDLPAGIAASDRYQISLTYHTTSQSTPVFMTECPDEDFPNGGVWPVLVDRTFSWTTFSCNQPVTVEVTKLYGGLAEEVIISPKSYGIVPTYFDGTTVRFTLNEPEYVSVRFVSDDNTDEYDQIKHGLMIFADVLETDVPSPGDPGVTVYDDTVDLSSASIIYFGPGYYDLGGRFTDRMLPLIDDQAVYIAGGAWVDGGIFATNTYRTKLYGRGVMSGRFIQFRHPYYRQFCEMDPWNPRIPQYRGGQHHVQGVTLVDPFFHTMVVGQDSLVQDIKIIGWRVNNDGMRTGNNTLVDHVFIKTADDYFYATSTTTITDCVLWPMWNGATLQLGWGDYGGSGTVFIDNDIINPEWEYRGDNQGFMASMIEPDSQNENLLVEDVRIEGFINALANLHMKPATVNKPAGFIRNITFRNITMEQPQWWVRNQIGPGKSLIEGLVQDDVTYYTHDLTFENLFIDGELITDANKDVHFEIDPETTYNIRFTTYHCGQKIPFDTTGPGGEPDCRVDIYDLMAFADEWLLCNRMPAEACNE